MSRPSRFILDALKHYLAALENLLGDQVWLVLALTAVANVASLLGVVMAW